MKLDTEIIIMILYINTYYISYYIQFICFKIVTVHHLKLSYSPISKEMYFYIILIYFIFIPFLDSLTLIFMLNFI